MSDQMSLPGIDSATFSPVLASGHMPCVPWAGPTTAPSGPAPALASLSARQAKERGLLTSGTCGLRGFTSSASADLQKSLESRLRTITQTLGSTLYKMTWKPWVTPSGRCRSRLRASAPRTSATGSTGLPMASPWATPAARDWKDSGADLPPRADGTERFDQLPRQANLAGWATPRAEDGESSGARWDRGAFDTLTAQATHLAGWPSPKASVGGLDWAILDRPGTGSPSLPTIATLAGWPTAAASDGSGGRMPADPFAKVRPSGAKVC